MALPAVFGPASASGSYRDTVATTPGLVSHWRLGEPSGLAAVDQQGTNNGTYLGSPTLGAEGLVAQDADGAPSFDGVDDRIKVQNSLSLGVPSSLTFEAWVKRTSTATVQSLFDKGGYWANFPSSGRVQFGLYLNGGHVQLVSGSNEIVAGTTYHLAFTWDGAAMRIYKNGVEIASKPAVGTLSSSYDLIIGAESSGYEARGEYFLGSIDEVALYSSALGVSELRQHYAAGVADTTAPDTTITSGPSGTTQSASAAFAFASTEPGSTFECRLDGGAWSSCSSPKSYSGLTPGEHTFETRAADTAFNVDPSPASRNWRFEPDATPPDTTITSGPADPSPSPRPVFEFGSSEAGSIFECRLDGGAWSGCSSPKSYAKLTDGRHTFEVRATDASSNTDQSPAAWTWAVEVSPYASLIRNTSSVVSYWRFGEATGTTAVDETATNSGTYLGSPTLGVSGLLAEDADTAASFDGLDDRLKVINSISLGVPSALTWEGWIRPSTGNCGRHLFDKVYYAASFTCSGNLRFMLRPNGVFTDLYSPANAFVAGQTYHLALTWDGATMRIYKNGVELASKAAAGTLPTSYNLIVGAESSGYDGRGDYFSGTMDEVALYSRGLTGAEVKRHYDVGRDPTPPETTITASPPDNTNATTARFEFSSSEPGSSFECRLDGGTWTACSSPREYTSLGAGQHAVDVRATDAAGNADRTPAGRTWTIDNCSVRWTGPLANGTWHTATNWSTGAVPTAADSVCLPANAAVTSSDTAAVRELHASDAALTVKTGTLNLADSGGVSRVKTLTLSGAITGPGELRVVSSLSWNYGAMTGSGTTVLEPGATATTTGGTLDRRTLRNEGSITHEGTQQLVGKNGALLENKGTYTLNAEPCSGCTVRPGIVWSPAGDVAPRIVNSGIFRRTAGAGYAYVDFGFENQGTVNVEAGDLFFARGAMGAVSRGSWTGSNGGTANLTGPFTLGSEVELVGAVKARSPSVVTVASFEAPAGSLTVDSGARLDLADSSGVSRLRDLTLSGTVTGPGTVRVGGSLAWSAGTMRGAGTTVLEAGATATIGYATLDQRTLRNEGEITHASSNQLIGKNGALLDNRGTYTLEAAHCAGCIQQAGILWNPADDAQPRFVNHGILRRASGTGYAEVGFGFENQGSVSIQAGSVSFRRGASGAVSRGSWAGSGTGAPVISGPFSFGDGTDLAGAVRIGTGGAVSANGIGGAGPLTVDSGGALDLSDPLATSRIDRLTLAGTVTGPGQLRIGSSLAWNDGTMSGIGTTVLEPGATATMNGGTLNRRTLRNEGEIVHGGHRTLLGKAGAVLDNRGTYTLNTERCTGCSYDEGIMWTPAGDAQPTFVNHGMLRRTAGERSAELHFGFENQGSVSIEAGSVNFHRSATGAVSRGSWSSSGTGVPVLYGSFAFGPGVQLSGVLRIGAFSGRVTAVDIQAPNGAVDIAPGGTLDLAEAGAASRVNGLTISGPASPGTLTGPGDVRVTGSLVFTSGTMKGSGLTVIDANAEGQIHGPWAILDGRTLRNDGHLYQGPGSRLIGKNGGVLHNRGMFTLNAERCGGCLYDSGLIAEEGTTILPKLVNTGSVLKTAGTGTADVTWEVDNLGTIRALTGKIDLRGPIVRSAPQPGESYGPGNAAMPNLRRSCAGKPVDCASGNQFEVQTDLEVGGRGLGLQMTRTYNSQAAAKQTAAGALGYGWTASYTDRLLVEADQRRATVTQGDGSAVPFLIGSDGRFSTPDWVAAKLVKNPDGTYMYTLPNQQTATFDASGRLMAQADRNGNKTTIAYDIDGRLSKVTDPAGRSLDYRWTDGKVTSVTDPSGLMVRYGYDAGELVSVRYEGDADPTWSFDYDASHQLTSMTDARGGTTLTEYDLTNRAIRQTDALQRTRQWEYLADETKMTEPNGGVTHLFFDEGQPAKIVRAAGTLEETTRRYVYDSKRRTVESVDGNGHSTTFTYDTAGNRTSATDPTGRTWRWTYNSARDVMSATTPSGRTTTIERDAKGNPTSLSRTFTDDGVQKTQRVTMAYDDRGQLVSTKDPLDHATTFEYDTAGNQVAKVDPNGKRSTATYDVSSRVETTTSPRGNAPGADPAAYTTRITRDKYGRPTGTRDALGRTTSTKYDANGNVVEATDAAGRTTLAEYDAENQLIKETLGDGSVRRIAYDAAGAVASRTDGAGKTTTYVRDGAGNVTEVVDPLGRRTVRRYDDNGNTTALIDALQRTTTYAYDDADRLTRASHPAPDADEVAYAYDTDGQRTTTTNEDGQATYTYDDLGRLAATHSAAGDVVRFGYDLADRRTRLTYPNGEDVTTAYDAGGRATSVTDWLSHTTTFEYDADSNLVGKGFPTTTATTDKYDYDAAGRLTHVTLGQNGGTPARLDYSYGSRVEVSGVTVAGLPGGTSETYEYDAAGRLAKDGLANLAFDLAGNATKLQGSSALTYDAAGQLETATTTADTLDFDFDAVGQRTSSTPSGGAATTFGYDGAGNLTSVDAPDTEAVTFGYDAEGLRSEKHVGTTVKRYAWDHGTRTPLLLKEGATSYIHGPDGLPLASIDAHDDMRYFHRDRLGSIRTVTDASGARVAAQTFDAYGNVIEQTGEDVPFGFAGQFTDAETGLVYMRARYYDPATGQFISRDPLEDLTLQPYLYAGGDPVNAIDPTGLLPWGIGGPDLPSLEDFSNAAAGFGDAVTFGGTQKIRAALGIDNVDYCSAAYGAGGFAGDVVALAVPAERLIFVGMKLGKAVKGGRNVPDDFIVVRGGTRDLPPPGETFSGAAGRTLEEAASSVPHGQIRTTTARGIRAGGGTVKHAPERTRTGTMNPLHVDICLGPGRCPFGELQPNPVPKPGRIR